MTTNTRKRTDWTNSPVLTVTLPVLITGIFSLLSLRYSYHASTKAEESAIKADTVVAKVDVVAEKVEEVHASTNSMKTELVIATEKAARAAGKEEGIRQERAKQFIPKPIKP